MHWAQLVFGWPSALGGIFLSHIGLMLGSWRLVILGATVSVPFMLYVLAMPLFGPLAILAVGTHWWAAFALRDDQRERAWLLFIPTPAVTALFFLVVMG